jgi:hypothetical protein
LKIYFAGDPAVIHSRYTPWPFRGMKRWLVSYEDMKRFNDRADPRVIIMYYNMVAKQGHELFLDSGAFSVFRQGIEIDIDEYIRFCKKYHGIFKVIAALDVIGSGPRSFDNYLYMRDAGLKEVLPAWHYRDDKSLIKKYMDYTDYIAIGNLVSISLDQRLRAKVIREAINIMKSINPNVKIHLYGVTALQLVKMFGTEIYSLDSTAWLVGSKFATVYNNNGTFDMRGKILQGNPRNSFAINAYNARKFMELEDFINDQIKRREASQTGQRGRISLQNN